jgi:FkbM family methyltransferase
VSWARSFRRYLRLGLRLREIAGDSRSRWLLVYLGATTVLRSKRFGLPGSVRLKVRLGGVVYPIMLKMMSELDVLREVGVDDEYGSADGIPAETIVDLGANVGLATLRLLASHPGARVVAVEADPALVPRLRRNVAGLPVTVVHAAVCGASGERVLYTSRSSSWVNSLSPNGDSRNGVRVPAISFEDLLVTNGIERVDLLKLDVEGAEWEIVGGDVPASVEAIVGEAHDAREGTAQEFIERVGASMEVTTTWVGDGQATFVARRRSGPGASSAVG